MKKYLFLLPLLTAACNSGSVTTTTQRLESASEILEYTPAPGQFINEALSGFDNVTTPEAACRYAQGRLATGDYISLGGWGGYLVARFDKPVKALAEGYEIYIAGNPMATSSEPGVVWVMQDRNGNGLADDGPWFELRGSEFDRSVRDYSITYTRPSDDNQPVQWRDNKGQTGEIERMNQHRQSSYYPAWIETSELTFEGVRLPDNVGQGTVEGEQAWTPTAFAWGYVDNYSKIDMARGYNRLRIADAITSDGLPARLQQIDFVKIQTGVNAKAPAIGEISTEVCGIACMRIVAGK